MSDKADKIHFYRILDLVINVGTECLLLVFYKLTPRNTVANFFSSLTTQFSKMKRNGLLKDVQYQLVTASNPDPDKFDITLLSCLLTNVFPGKINKPPSGWNPNSTDTSLSADLIRMRNLRNEVAHRGNAKMTNDEFNKQFTYVEEILIRIANSVSTDVERHIQKQIFQIKTKEEYEDRVIAAWTRTCEEWKSNLEKIQTNTDETNQVVKAIDNKVNNLTETVEALVTGPSKTRRKGSASVSGACGENDAYSGHGCSLSNSAHEDSLSAEEWKIVKMLQRDFISYYRKMLSKLQLSPLIEEDEYAANFFDIYVKPNITILGDQEHKGQSELTNVTFHDIFSYKSDQNIYILSPAGCGKTSFAKYLALIWCQAHQPIVLDSQWLLEEDVNEMRTFMFLFTVFLRDSHESECDVDIMIQNQLLPNLSNSIIYAELGMKFLQKLLSSVKCIIILDGLDEWSHPPRNMCMLKNKHIPHSRARPMCTTLTTSRPWKLDVVGLKPGEIDQKLEINGLNNDLFTRLINNVVTKMNKVHRKKMQADDFEQVLQAKKLTDLSRIPVVVMQLLTVWFDNEPIGESQCEIYSNMIEFLLKHCCKKREIFSGMEDMEVKFCSRNRQIPMCLQYKMYCKIHMELLTKLATLAYNTLFTDNEETSLVFDRTIAKKYLTDPEIEMSLQVGILTQEKVIGKVSIRQSHISFIHKTFQEYLAALYVALSPEMVTNVEEKIKHVCCSIEKILEMSQMFMFLSGLYPKVMVNLHEHLRQTVSEDRVTRRYRATCGLEPWVSSGGRTLLQVQDTIVKWLGECWLNGHKHVTHLPVSNFFIGSPSRWSAELKSLVLHNPVCTLSVVGAGYSPEEIEDILNSVTVFNFIKKLSLSWVAETFVVQLVSQHKHNLSVRPETWRHLEWLTLQGVKMSGDILCSFVDSILSKSVQVMLMDCSISQGTRDWKAYIRSHSRLTVDKDDVEDDRRWWNVKLLQFHTNEV